MSRTQDRLRVAQRLSDDELEALAERTALDVAVDELRKRNGGER